MSAYIARKIIPVTPSDTVALPTGPTNGLLVGTAGAATIVEEDGTVRASVPLQAGYNPISVLRINATGLTAANIWALY